jgi:hypothetical protein
VLSISANFDLRPENEIDFVIEKAKLGNIENLFLSEGADCAAEGLFVFNCTSFKLCVDIGGGNLIGVEGTCIQYNFNPSTLQCDPDYDCPQCTKAGFICLSDTSFRYCSDAPEVVVNNVTCPTDHYCNEVCKHPCIKFLYNC